MAYLANNHKNNIPSAKSNNSMPNNSSTQKNKALELVNNKNKLLSNGYKGNNNSKDQNSQQGNNASQMKQTMQKVKEKTKKETARKAIVTGLKAYNPAIGAAADKALQTEQGEKLLDEYAKGDTPAEGIKNVKKELTKKTRRYTIMITVFSFALPLLFLLLILLLIFKNADSQIFSNENGGTVESENYGFDDKETNIFANYPGLYEKIVSVSEKISDEYQIEVDKFLIISTLVAPIENGLIIPVNDGSCGEEECFYFKGQSKTWSEFLSSWADQSELLAKMQILTYTNNKTDVKVSCGEEQTMEQFAKNDLKTNTFPWYGWLNPVNWFKGFRDSAGAELNGVCTEAPNGKTKVPTIRVLSTEQGEFYKTNNANGEYVYVKDSNSGGVYFWNLVNQNGFIHEYLKDYLSDQFADDSEKNYEINKDVIVDTVNYIYAYYDSIRKDCESHKVLESSIKKIKVYNPPSKQSTFGLPEHDEVDFEDQYIGGVMLAEYNSGNMESLKAFAILARTEAVAVVGLDGSGEIENSSNDQNYDPTYSPEKYPKIAEAVAATRGIVVSKYKEPKVWHTEYDGFCPESLTLEKGFYYLPEGQQNLPINPEAYKNKTGSDFLKPEGEDAHLNCPCFKDEKSRPHDEIIDRKSIKYSSSNTTPPTDSAGKPEQTTKEVCWNLTEYTKDGQYGWEYKAYGHGRGASQLGLKYFGAFGYSQDALIRMFFPGANIRVLSGSLQNGKCSTIDYYTGEVGTSSGESSD